MKQHMQFGYFDSAILPLCGTRVATKIFRFSREKNFQQFLLKLFAKLLQQITVSQKRSFKVKTNFDKNVFKTFENEISRKFADLRSFVAFCENEKNHFSFSTLSGTLPERLCDTQSI
jgi:hypothetical protein